MQPVRVLIIDDSRTMCAMIAHALSGDPRIEVVGTAADPLEARTAMKALSPDVITLDVEMPGMDGIEFLRRVMALRPTPVIMISTLTGRGAETAIEALSIGAFECLGKPSGSDPMATFRQLPSIIVAAARSPIARRRLLPAPRKTAAEPEPGGGSRPRPGGPRPSKALLAIGASTGGVDAIMTVLKGFPAQCPPTVITQHMPEGFTASFARRLDQTCAPKVAEATEGAPLLPGHVYLAPGGNRHLEIKGLTKLVCALSEGDPVNGHCPAVDVLFHSAAHFGRRTIGVLLTGMGNDGAAGLKAIRDAGGRTIGQDKRTSVVYGMPGAASRLGAVEAELGLPRIARSILGLCDEIGGATA